MFELRVVGFLDASANAPTGVLIDRSYCLPPDVGGLIGRLWVRVAPDARGDVLKRIAAGFPGAALATPEQWRETYSGGTTLVEKLFRLLMAVLVASMAAVLWVLGRFSFSHNAHLIRTACALGLTPRHLRSLALADGLVSGLVAAVLIAGALTLGPTFRAGATLRGPL